MSYPLKNFARKRERNYIKWEGGFYPQIKTIQTYCQKALLFVHPQKVVDNEYDYEININIYSGGYSVKFECLKSDFIRALNCVSNFVSDKNIMPILSNVLIEAQENQLILTVTDLKVCGRTFLKECQVQEIGTLTIPAKKLHSIIKELDDDSLTFQLVENNVCELSCGKSLYKLHSIPKEEFPGVEFAQEKNMELSQKSLKEGLKLLLPAVSTDISRPFLNGVYFELKNSQLNLVSTDGKRLSFFKIPISDQTLECSCIVHTKILQELIRNLFDNEEAMIGLSFTQRGISFLTDDFVYHSQFIEGQFPDYERVLPDNYPHSVQLDINNLIGVLKRAIVISPSSQGTSRIKLAFSLNNLNVTVVTEGQGEFNESIEVPYEGESLDMGVNPYYIYDGIKNLPLESPLTVEFESANRQVHLTTDSGYRCVVMPMKL